LLQNFGVVSGSAVVDITAPKKLPPRYNRKQIFINIDIIFSGNQVFIQKDSSYIYLPINLNNDVVWHWRDFGEKLTYEIVMAGFVPITYHWTEIFWDWPDGCPELLP
jgi:hypothetical protein